MGERPVYLQHAVVDPTNEIIKFSLQSRVEGTFSLAAWINIFSLPTPLRNEVEVTLVEGENAIELHLPGMSQGDYQDASISWNVFKGTNGLVEKYVASGTIRRRL